MIVQLASDSLTTVVPPTLTTSCPLQVPLALALPLKVALTASPVVVFPVQVTVPDADFPLGSALRSAVQSGPLASVTPASASEVVIADSTDFSNAVSRAVSIWPDAVTVGLGLPRVGPGVGLVPEGLLAAGVPDGAGVAPAEVGVIALGLAAGVLWPPQATSNETVAPAASASRRPARSLDTVRH